MVTHSACTPSEYSGTIWSLHCLNPHAPQHSNLARCSTAAPVRLDVPMDAEHTACPRIRVIGSDTFIGDGNISKHGTLCMGEGGTWERRMVTAGMLTKGMPTKG